MQKVKYSVIIDHPSPDQSTKGREQAHCTFAVADLDNLKHLTDEAMPEGWIIPARILRFFKAAIDEGSFRVEIIDGGGSYKLYVRPDDWDSLEDGTKINERINNVIQTR